METNVLLLKTFVVIWSIFFVIYWIVFKLQLCHILIHCWHMGCRCGVTCLCCQLIARPGSGTTMPLWPDPYHLVTKSPQTSQMSIFIDNCYLLLLKYHYVLIMHNLHYVYHTIDRCNIVVICIVCTHVHWTKKAIKKKYRDSFLWVQVKILILGRCWVVSDIELFWVVLYQYQIVSCKLLTIRRTRPYR